MTKVIGVYCCCSFKEANAYLFPFCEQPARI